MRNIIFAMVFLLVSGHQRTVKASALNGPMCSVKVKVVHTGGETRRTDSGREYKNFYVDIMVVDVSGEKSCPVAKGQFYRASDTHPGVFRKGDILKAGVERASSMEPNGPVGFLQWSELTYDDGIFIFDANKVRIDFLQSGDTPIKSNKKKKTRRK